MKAKDKLNDLYEEKNNLLNELKQKELLIKYIFRVLTMCFYLIFMSINIYIFKINTIPSILLGALFSYAPTIPIKYNLNKIVRKEYNRKNNKINILIHLLENNTKTNNNTTINKKKEEYNYEYNPNVNNNKEYSNNNAYKRTKKI